jgi:hypothetical protein
MNAPKMVYIKGPMHPDLFDGETPIMLAIPVSEAGKVFEVEITYTVSGGETTTVMAVDGDDAKTAAAEWFADEFPCSHEIDYMTVRELDEKPTDDMVQEFIERREAA